MAQEGLKNLDQGLLELEALVKELENSNLSIDDAIEKYAQGMELAVACRAQQLGAQPNAIPNAQVAGQMPGLPGNGNQGSW